MLTEQERQAKRERLAKATKAAKAYLVLTECGGEGVMFSNRPDARFAATGYKTGFDSSTLAETFREIYAYDEPNKQFRMVEIEAPSKETEHGKPIRN